MQKWEVLESRYLLKSPYGNIRQDVCRLSNGRIIDDLVVTEYGEWVNIVAITKDNQVLFVRQYRHGYGDFAVEVPGGSVRDGEPPVEAILRELKEETGYVSDEQPVQLGRFATNPALASNWISTFLVQNVYKASEQQLDDTEDIEVFLVPFDEVPQKILRGEITQSFTVSACLVAREYLREGREVSR